MSVRNSVQDIQDLLSLDDTTAVFPQLRAASRFVDSHLLSKGLSADVLKEIEGYLAGHFYRLNNPLISQEAYGGGAFRYAVGDRKMGLMSTEWGQMAVSSDTSGTLSNMGKAKAAIDVL